MPLGSSLMYPRPYYFASYIRIWYGTTTLRWMAPSYWVVQAEGGPPEKINRGTWSWVCLTPGTWVLPYGGALPAKNIQPATAWTVAAPWDYYLLNNIPTSFIHFHHWMPINFSQGKPFALQPFWFILWIRFTVLMQWLITSDNNGSIIYSKPYINKEGQCLFDY